MTQDIQQLLERGKSCLFQGDIQGAKEIAVELTAISEGPSTGGDHHAHINDFLRDFLISSQIDSWLKKDDKELEVLLDAFKHRVSQVRPKGLFD